jgi:hypothetical protein
MNLPLVFKRQHLFIQTAAGLWVYDTGSPDTIGETGFNPLNSNAVKARSMSDISEFLGVKVVGLIGTDVLNAYDHLIDLREGHMSLEYSEELLTCDGGAHGLRFIAPKPGTTAVIPTLQASLGGSASDYIFDTGAPLSYHLGPVPDGAVPCCNMQDFWLPIGNFTTQTYHAQTYLDVSQRWLKYGTPPAQLEQALQGYKTSGIIGNEVMRGRITGYFPRRGILILQP